MKKNGVTAAMLALLAMPMAAAASDSSTANPKLPMASVTEPLLRKDAVAEQRMTYACMLGRAGGTTLSMLLGSGSAWDALTDALSGLPPSAEQRAFCALGEVLTPHVATAAEGLSQEAWSAAQRQAEAVQEMITTGSVQIGQAWAGFRNATTETGNDLARVCEASPSCTKLRDTAAYAWSRLWPMR